MLTDSQRKMAEDNHNLIYGYARQKYLDLDEYYGILAIALCKAARVYDKSRGAFATIAYTCMDNDVAAHIRSEMKKSRIPNAAIVSYDSEANQNLLEEISNSLFTNTENAGIMLSTLKGMLTSDQRDILKLLLQGMTQKEISEIRCCKIENVWYNIKQIRKKASRLLN